MARSKSEALSGGAVTTNTPATCFIAVILAALACAPAPAGELVISAEKARIREIGGPIPNGGWNLWSEGALGEWLRADKPGRVRIVIRAAGQPAAGVFPLASVDLLTGDLKGRSAGRLNAASTEYRDYPFTVDVDDRPFRFTVRFLNDRVIAATAGRPAEDRNLLIKELRIMGAQLAAKVPSIMDQAGQRIRKHRAARATLTVTGPDGQPLANAAVTVRMTRHRFLFGCNIFKLGTCRTPEDNRLYAKRFRELLNYATLPFYWHGYEGTRGRPQHDSRMKVARWCKQNGIRTKGHPLFWTLEPPWLGKLPREKSEPLTWARIEREVKHFAGAIDIWDVLNEPVVGIEQAKQRKAINALRLYQKLGQVEVIKRAFDHARKAGPQATLILNDFRSTPEFARIIRDCLKQGVPIDVIGIQSHMHGGYWGALRAWQVCERFAGFGKPIHFTELTILSGQRKTDADWEGRRAGWDTTPAGEKKQAAQAAELYTLLFSHPAVEAITWWDFADQGAWQGAPAGFLRKDMSPKPVYHALMKLIKTDWWTGPLTLKTDTAGRVAFRGFLGNYAVEAAGGKGRFSLGQAGTCDVSATLRR